MNVNRPFEAKSIASVYFRVTEKDLETGMKH